MLLKTHTFTSLHCSWQDKGWNRRANKTCYSDRIKSVCSKSRIWHLILYMITCLCCYVFTLKTILFINLVRLNQIRLLHFYFKLIFFYPKLNNSWQHVSMLACLHAGPSLSSFVIPRDWGKVHMDSNRGISWHLCHLRYLHVWWICVCSEGWFLCFCFLKLKEWLSPQTCTIPIPHAHSIFFQHLHSPFPLSLTDILWLWRA